MNTIDSITSIIFTSNSCKWLKDGFLHRDRDLPAYTEFYEEGNIKIQIWYQNGVIYREGNKPSKITYFKDGSIKKENGIIMGQ